MTRHERLAALLILAAALWLVIATAVAAGYLAGVALAASRPEQLAASLVPPADAAQGEGPDVSPRPLRTVGPDPDRITPSVGSLPALELQAEPEPVAASTPAADVPSVAGTISGVASTYGPGWDGWLALPEGPGVRVRICGAGGCVVRTSTDAGPSLAMQRAGRIVDLDVPDFEAVCGCSWRTGLVRVTVEYLR